MSRAGAPRPSGRSGRAGWSASPRPSSRDRISSSASANHPRATSTQDGLVQVDRARPARRIGMASTSTASSACPIATSPACHDGRDSVDLWRKSRTSPGGAARSSTRCTSAASPTETGTASATSPGCGRRSRYLAGLGVDAIWINPWYPSPMADGGYDVSDYRDVEPRFGTLADAEALIQEAHDAGLRVLLDIVPNHTSDQHPWFRGRAGGRARVARAAALPLPRRPGSTTATNHRTTGTASSAVRRGRG